MSQNTAVDACLEGRIFHVVHDFAISLRVARFFVLVHGSQSLWSHWSVHGSNFLYEWQSCVARSEMWYVYSRSRAATRFQRLCHESNIVHLRLCKTLQSTCRRGWLMAPAARNSKMTCSRTCMYLSNMQTWQNLTSVLCRILLPTGRRRRLMVPTTRTTTSCTVSPLSHSSYAICIDPQFWRFFRAFRLFIFIDIHGIPGSKF